MKDFKKYQQENAKDKNVNAAVDGATQTFLEGEAAALARKALEAYNGKSENFVLLEILRQAEEGKRAGTLTNADIDAFYMQFSPMLEESQRKKLLAVIERLKRI